MWWLKFHIPLRIPFHTRYLLPDCFRQNNVDSQIFKLYSIYIIWFLSWSRKSLNQWDIHVHCINTYLISLFHCKLWSFLPISHEVINVIAKSLVFCLRFHTQSITYCDAVICITLMVFVYRESFVVTDWSRKYLCQWIVGLCSGVDVRSYYVALPAWKCSSAQSTNIL